MGGGACGCEGRKEGEGEGDRRIQLSQRMVDECIRGRYMMSHGITSEGRSVACCNKSFIAGV